jgi:cytochrome c551/c552
VPWIFAAAVVGAAGAARSQSNLDAGKSPEQIFADTCSACHAHAHTLRSPDATFLRQHYTTSARQAAAMAAYVQTAIHNPPPPPPPPPALPAPKTRRPSDSIETGPSGEIAIGEAAPAHSPRAAALPFADLEE